MSVNPALPDHDLADTLVLTTTAQVKALSHALRTAILGMLHERAASVSELATALERPRSTVAYHVAVLEDAGLVQVVRTRRVRAVEERFYGRTARLFHVGVGGVVDADGEPPRDFNDFEVAARESATAFRDGKLWGFIRHARITEEQAGAFWEEMATLVRRFEVLPRAGDTVHGFAIGIYPADHPTLPPEDVGPPGESVPPGESLPSAESTVPADSVPPGDG